MIKLKSLISEEQDESINVEQYFWPDGKFDYDRYVQLSPEERYDAALAIIHSSKASELTEPEVFHVIIGLGNRSDIKSVYDFATKYLTPEQLFYTRKQINIFHKEFHSRFVY